MKEIVKTSEKKNERQSAGLAVCDLLEVVATSVLIVMLLFTFVMRIAIVKGTSMTNTLHDGDKMLVWELGYTPKQGDIIVCQTQFFGFEEPIVKRVIATEGQTITLDVTTWSVYVDGVKLEEDYVRYVAGKNMNGWSYGDSYTVPEGHVFCMGDNRNGSWDCRDSNVGPIDLRYVIGRVVLRISPLSAIRFF